MPWGQVVSWYPSWRHELVNDRCPMNSAGTAGPIRTRDGSFDAPERRWSRGAACHVPPREPFEKCCVRIAAQTGSGREPKLSGQKRLGLNCVSMGESAPRGQNCAPRGAILFFSAFCPLARTPLNPGTPNLVHGCTWARAIRIFIIWGVQKLGQIFGFLIFLKKFVLFFLSS